MNAGLLESIERHPMATLMVIAILFLIREIVKIWRGKTDATTTERESLKFARQTSETVNKCSTRSHDIMDMVEKYHNENDLGQVSAKLTDALQLLETLDARSSVHTVSLDRLNGLCDRIMDDLHRSDSRVVHNDIISKVDAVQRLSEDTKQLAIHIAEKI